MLLTAASMLLLYIMSHLSMKLHELIKMRGDVVATHKLGQQQVLDRKTFQDLGGPIELSIEHDPHHVGRPVNLQPMCLQIHNVLIEQGANKAIVEVPFLHRGEGMFLKSGQFTSMSCLSAGRIMMDSCGIWDGRNVGVVVLGLGHSDCKSIESMKI
ncbi:hypothetical protein B0H17DRAFT_1129402 [Mycena rosella]|uniref:Uncharacterized protein n=1 Tax=Mycena rosella TaxID=1033263 RepID=A0AAD7DU15_MYCRO|nr:hypothetical protein B0H17DRAFT_1129402 [Mycena rosella]